VIRPTQAVATVDLCYQFAAAEASGHGVFPGNFLAPPGQVCDPIDASGVHGVDNGDARVGRVEKAGPYGAEWALVFRDDAAVGWAGESPLNMDLVMRYRPARDQAACTL
jgi:hypothetical protein